MDPPDKDPDPDTLKFPGYPIRPRSNRYNMKICVKIIHYLSVCKKKRNFRKKKKSLQRKRITFVYLMLFSS